MGHRDHEQPSGHQKKCEFRTLHHVRKLSHFLSHPCTLTIADFEANKEVLLLLLCCCSGILQHNLEKNYGLGFLFFVFSTREYQQ